MKKTAAGQNDEKDERTHKYSPPPLLEKESSRGFLFVSQTQHRYLIITYLHGMNSHGRQEEAADWFRATFEICKAQLANLALARCPLLPTADVVLKTTFQSYFFYIIFSFVSNKRIKLYFLIWSDLSNIKLYKILAFIDATSPHWRTFSSLPVLPSGTCDVTWKQPIEMRHMSPPSRCFLVSIVLDQGGGWLRPLGAEPVKLLLLESRSAGLDQWSASWPNTAKEAAYWRR